MIFLSASIPLKERHPQYYDTADNIAIRDAVRALCTVVLPHSKLVWGGHPSINPLIWYVLQTMGIDARKRVVLYLSDFFREIYPKEISNFGDVKYIPSNQDRANSLIDMRNAMIKGNDFLAGIFIGGMDGVEEEYELFKETHPQALILPIANTGAAAKIIYDKMNPKPDKRLVEDYAYMALFKSLLSKKINLGDE